MIALGVLWLLYVVLMSTWALRLGRARRQQIESRRMLARLEGR